MTKPTQASDTRESLSAPPPTAPEIAASEIVDELSAFKLAFRRHAAGVAAITALDANGSPVGFTATSLASLSAVPPLATFSMAITASSWPALESTDHVVVNFLGARNHAVARTMSGPNVERFQGEHWAPGPLGLPVLRNVPAWMLGRIVERIRIEQSVVVIIRIEDGGLGEPDQPLIYHERSYSSPGPSL